MKLPEDGLPEGCMPEGHVCQKDICQRDKYLNVNLEMNNRNILPKGCMIERRLQECQMSKGLFGDK